MAYAEIDSFVLKLKNLLYAGINADLRIRSEAGKAFVTLAAEVKVPPPSKHHARAGGARERRRERRAAERAAAVVHAVPVDVGTSDVADPVEEFAPTDKIAAEALDLPTTKTHEKAETVEKTAFANVRIVQPSDEIENETISSATSSGTGTPRQEEVCQVSIIPVRKIDISDEEIAKILMKKLCAKDVKVRDLFIQRSRNGIFVRCDVFIEPMQGDVLENTNFGFGHCKVVPIYGLL